MPLHVAVRSENLALIALLIEWGAILDAQDDVSSQAKEILFTFESLFELVALTLAISLLLETNPGLKHICYFNSHSMFVFLWKL